MAKWSYTGLVAAALIGQAAVSGAAVPAQFIAKMYSEALGRTADPQAWNSAVDDFQAKGCNQTQLSIWGSGLFASAEFLELSYDNAAATLILYRSIFNREPDAAGFKARVSALEGGETLANTVLAFFGSAEFAALVPQICSGNSYSFASQGTGSALDLSSGLTAGHANLTQAQLQSLLDSSAAGTAVYLQQKTVVLLTEPLRIPAGVTLATFGLPGPHRHALMARLIRAAAFPSPMVQINLDANPNPSGSLKSVWVDGQRSASTPFVAGAINVEIYGGQAATVDSNFLTNSLGWSTIHSYGSLDGRPCAGNIITNNVITAYSSVHANSQWTDGISVGCENSLVQNNQIVDPTDVGIVVFTAYPAVQKSRVSHNVVVSAGNSAFGALAFDPLQNRSAGAPDFTGSAISDNTLWSGPNTHFIIGLAIGSRPWYANGSIGYGGAATGNTTAGVTTRFGAGIVVSGMDAATVQQNVLQALLLPPQWTGCPVGDVLASISVGLASGSIQPFSDVNVNGCMGDYSPSADAASSAPATAQTGITVLPQGSSAPETSTAAAASPPSKPTKSGGGAFGGWEVIVLGLLVIGRRYAQRSGSQRPI